MNRIIVVILESGILIADCNQFVSSPSPSYLSEGKRKQKSGPCVVLKTQNFVDNPKSSSIHFANGDNGDSSEWENLDYPIDGLSISTDQGKYVMEDILEEDISTSSSSTSYVVNYQDDFDVAMNESPTSNRSNQQEYRFDSIPMELSCNVTTNTLETASCLENDKQMGQHMILFLQLQIFIPNCRLKICLQL
jgi:hypothetical protein